MKWQRLRIPLFDLLTLLALAAAAIAIYRRVFDFGFVNYDDGQYVYENAHLRLGFTPENLRWVLFSLEPDNWFPLTRLSLLLDYRFFALDAGFYHAENVAIHILASFCLFGFLRRATGAKWPAAFAAFGFAVHPLHVESVAWVAERKDVLCALFWFAALWVWALYAGRPGWLSYSGALLLFACGAMAKPMIVTFPVLLFVLDYWPFHRGMSRKTIVEKIPFGAVAGALMAVTMLAQRSAGAVKPVELYPLGMRLGNAVISIGAYLRDTFRPADLWAAHAWPLALSLREVVASAAVILLVSVTVFRWRSRKRYLAAGWLWFLITLLPVIGLVQVGTQSRADRYMYVPMAGILTMVCWGVAELVAAKPIAGRLAASVAGLALLVLGCAAWVQTGYWKDTETLFRHSIASDARDYVAWELLGHNRENDPATSQSAVDCYRRGLAINPRSVEIHNHLGIELTRLGRYDEAIAVHRESLRLYPQYSTGHYNLGEALMESGRRGEAMAEYAAALAVDPDFAEAHNELGAELWRTGRIEEGIRHLEQAVRLKPDFALAQYNLGKSLMGQRGRTAEAMRHFREVLRLNPLSLPAHADLGTLLAGIPGERDEAILHLETAQEIAPDPERQKLLERLERERSYMAQ